MAVAACLWLLAAGVAKWRRVPARSRPACCAADPSPRLPPRFLTTQAFSRAAAAHTHITQLRADAPYAFQRPPVNADGLDTSIVLRGDFRQELARGREAYLRVFEAVAQVNSSPLVPLKAGDLTARFEPGFETLRVVWSTPVRPTASLPQAPSASAEFTFSGVSTYIINERGDFSEHLISDLRVNEQRLPSSEFGEWLDLLQQRSPSSPIVGLSLFLSTVRDRRPSSPPARKSSPTAMPSSAVPPPGSDGWPRYASLHQQALLLGQQFADLFTNQPDLSTYSDGIELRAETGELLLQGKAQYSQLIRSLSRVHNALIASPLLEHSLRLRLESRAGAGPWFDARGSTPPTGATLAGEGEAPSAALGEAAGSNPLGAEVERVGVRWQYELIGAPQRVGVLRLEACSVFELRCRAASEAAAQYVIQSHALRDLRLNGRPAIPAALLSQLRRAEESSPELLQFLSSAFLTLSESMLTPLPKTTSAPAATSTQLMDQPQFAVAFVRLIQVVHKQAPSLLTRAPDLSIFKDDVQVRGLLAEPLPSGSRRVDALLGALRQGFRTLQREGAITLKGDSADLMCVVEVTSALDVLVRLKFEALVGGWAERTGLLGVGLPVDVQAEVRLRFDSTSALVQMIWIKDISVNGRPLVPEILSRWVKQSADESRPGGSPDVSSLMRVLLPWLSRTST
ncbi:hypothetical protein AB1Y20_003053 [Prymnesium parvum]|uniref:Uncharacterized protein n=1 Tax=Prymnesium parvum TaxID=97485 RepID=A0AB34JDK3_PRYPA